MNRLRTLTPGIFSTESNECADRRSASGGSVQITMDRRGNFFIGPGATIGKGVTFVSSSVVVGTINQGATPHAQHVVNYLRENSCNLAGGGTPL